MSGILIAVGVMSVVFAIAWQWRKRLVVRKPVTSSASLRIGTFNTHLDSLIFEIAHAKPEFLLKGPSTFIDDYKAKVTARAQAIATRILTDGFDYDFIALIEVFSEEARAVLVDRLSGAYPYSVTRLPETDARIPDFMIGRFSEFLSTVVDIVEELFGPIAFLSKEDSGLMLFSRFPIDKVQFAPFTFRNEDEMVAAFPDSCAEKGAAYVRIVAPGGRRIHVVLTHLQENKEEWAWVRTAELQQIRALIESIADIGEHEDLFVMGDLNLNGLWTNIALPPSPKTIEDIEPAPSSTEWKNHFAAGAGFFSDRVHDTWFHETSRRDTGPTSLGGARIDYILHNDPAAPNTRALRIQHLTRTEIFDEAGAYISDHNGVNADLNLVAPHCNPRDAQVLVSFDDKPITGNIKYPGSMVWYRIDRAGTYAFAITDGSEVAFDVYQSIDLTHPIRGYKGEITIIEDARHHRSYAKKYHLPDAPYYVRVYHRDRGSIADYALLVHRQEGVDANDAIALVPYEWRSALFPSGTPLNADDTMWIRLHTERADTGKPQDLSFHLTGFTAAVTHVEIRAADTTTVLAGAELVAGKEVILRLKDVGPSQFYLLVRREDAAFASAGFVVEWRTNLTILHDSQPDGAGNPLMLICDNLTDPEIGADRIILRVWVDGVLRLSGVVGEFEVGDPVSLKPYIPAQGFRYLENIGVLIAEDDVWADDESEFTIPILRAHRESPADEIRHEFDGGRYILLFNRSHHLNP